MAEKGKRTPGPWTFDRDWNRIPTIIGADGSLVADIRKSSVNEGGWVVDMPEREANARLIAAAPELLGALEEIKDSYSEVRGGLRNPLLIQIDEIVSRAIAKAIGS